MGLYMDNGAEMETTILCRVILGLYSGKEAGHNPP